MPLTEAQREAFDLQCYGRSRHAVDADMARAIGWSGSIDKALASILSDVQELIERGHLETARQHLNCVKRVLFNRADYLQHEEQAQAEAHLDAEIDAANNQ